MNSADFIEGVGPQFLNETYGTSSGTVTTPSTEYFAQAYPPMSGGFDAGAPAADRAYPRRVGDPYGCIAQAGLGRAGGRFVRAIRVGDLSEGAR